MKTLLKLGAATALAAVFAGASAGEAVIDEIVVIGKRPSTALPSIEIERPVIPELEIDTIPLAIAIPALDVASAHGQARTSDASRT